MYGRRIHGSVSNVLHVGIESGTSSGSRHFTTASLPEGLRPSDTIDVQDRLQKDTLFKDQGLSARGKIAQELSPDDLAKTGI